MSLFVSCNTQKPTERTINQAIRNIEHKDYRALRGQIGIETTNDTSLESVVAKVVEANYFIHKYHSGSTDDLSVIYTDSIDIFGRHIVIVPLLDGYDSTTGLSNVKIVFGLGPFNLFPPDKLTAFEVESKVDVNYRIYMINNNILKYDFDSVTYIEYDKLKNVRNK